MRAPARWFGVRERQDLRILFIDKFYPPVGGVGSYTRCMTDELRNRGHEVFWFGTDKPGGPPDAPKYFDFTKTRNPLSVLRMIQNNEAAGKLAQFIRKHRIDVAHLHTIYHHLTPSILPVLARHRVAIVLRLPDYRLICPRTHFLRPSGHCMRCHANKYYHAASPACAGLAGVGLAIETYFQRFWRRYEKWVDFFICPTRFMRKVMSEASTPASKLIVLRNCVPPLPDTPGVLENPREILFAGRMSPEKSPEMMLELAARDSGIHATLAGDGPVFGRIEQEVSDRKLTNVTLTGHLQHAELAKLVRRAAVMIITSRWLENSTMSMLEAMRAGRCVVVPERGPLLEWVQDRKTGRVYAPEDIDSLAGVVREVLDSPSDRHAMGAAAAELVQRRHNPSTIAERLEILYAEAMRRSEFRR